MKKLILLLVVLLVACSSNSGDKYLGAWKSTTYAENVVLIERNGESFILNRHDFSDWDGSYRGIEKQPLSLKDGMLSDEFEKISYIEATDTLTDGSTEYKRVDRSVFDSAAQRKK
jgi:hypothetical protein